jgi:hypothetical protein
MSPLGFTPFHWSMETSKLSAESAAIDAIEAQVTAMPPMFMGTLVAPQTFFAQRRGTAPLASASNDGGQISVTFAQPLPAGSSVQLLSKRFANITDFTASPMTLDGGAFVGSTSDGPGSIFSVEVSTPSGAWRLPDLLQTTPYWVSAP